LIIEVFLNLILEICRCIKIMEIKCVYYSAMIEESIEESAFGRGSLLGNLELDGNGRVIFVEMVRELRRFL